LRESSAAPAQVSRRRNRARAARLDWLFALSLAIFVGVCVWFGRAIYDFFTPPTATIALPSFVGQTSADAVIEAQRVDVRGVIVAHAASDRFPQDVVMSQQPAAGTQVREGRQVSLIVSTGLQIFPMPDLRYESMREVNLDLSHWKLVLGKTRTVSNDDVAPGHVVSQDPAPLVGARSGTVVNLVLSKGTQSNVRAPNFVGMSIDDARDAANAAKVHLGQVVWTPFGRNGAPHGTVVRQNPGPGDRIDASQVISLQVSAGPEQAGYLVRQAHATVTVPNGDGPQLLRITVHDETGSWNVYNAYAQPRQKLDFNLTVIGTAELDAYVGDELLSSNVLGIEPSPAPSAEASP
jgi:beta-lactam-binding protein with PASTA domain